MDDTHLAVIYRVGATPVSAAIPSNGGFNRYHPVSLSRIVCDVRGMAIGTMVLVSLGTSARLSRLTDGELADSIKTNMRPAFILLA